MSCSQICNVQGARGFRCGRVQAPHSVLSVPPHPPPVLLDSEEVSLSGRCRSQAGAGQEGQWPLQASPSSRRSALLPARPESCGHHRLPSAAFSHLTSLNQPWNRRLSLAGQGHVLVPGVGGGASPREP